MRVETRGKTDFSDWLVASDIDGTLNNKLRRLPKRNYERICEFVLEKKGHFIFIVTVVQFRMLSLVRRLSEMMKESENLLKKASKPE